MTRRQDEVRWWLLVDGVVGSPDSRLSGCAKTRRGKRPMEFSICDPDAARTGQVFDLCADGAEMSKSGFFEILTEKA